MVIKTMGSTTSTVSKCDFRDKWDLGPGKLHFQMITALCHQEDRRNWDKNEGGSSDNTRPGHRKFRTKENNT